MSLCFDPADEQRLARGWPNLIEAVDGDPRDRTPAKTAMKAQTAIDPVHYTVWPRQSLVRYLRAETAALGATGKTYDVIRANRRAAAEKGAADASPMSPGEAIDALGQMMKKSDEIYPFQTDAFVYGVETIAGTDAVLEAIAAEARPGPDGPLVSCLAATAFLLMRASPKVAKAVRATLAGVLPRLKGDRAEALDRALGGVAAVKRSIGKWVVLDSGGGLLSRPPIEFASDDADWVREAVTRADAKAAMSVRVAWLGGPATLAGLSSRKWPARQMPSVVRDFGMLRAPEVVDLMASLLGKTSVKNAPIEWLRAHADYARPILAKSRSAMAQAALKQL
jgi:hypothetical protein